MIKHATTLYPVLDLIKERWSARSFSLKAITTKEVYPILEAESQAPSANNEQPWEFYYALKGSTGFDTIWSCLITRNQPWNKNAVGFIVTIARKIVDGNDKPNAYAEHDLGLATSNLLLQASSMGIFTHSMAGIDKVKLIESLHLNHNQSPLCVIALGYLDDAEKLEEPFKGRELTERVRKPLSEIVKEL